MSSVALSEVYSSRDMLDLVQVLVRILVGPDTDALFLPVPQCYLAFSASLETLTHVFPVCLIYLPSTVFL